MAFFTICIWLEKFFTVSVSGYRHFYYLHLYLLSSSGGDYAYFGIRKGIENALNWSKDKINVDKLELCINVDGLPVYKSKNTSLWPVQVLVSNLTSCKPFVAALFYGSGKPTDLDFLEDFTSELKHLMENGLSLDEGRRLPVVVKCFVCDAPARALIKGTVQFNGTYGCDFCCVKGCYNNHRMLFHGTGALRTNTTFRCQDNKEHHKFSSILLSLDIDMIVNFPIDPMHCIDLGVMKKLLLTWREGPKPLRLSAGHLNLISAYLSALKPFFPSEFNRKPRGLDELKFWKATEFRTFLLYCGPVILRYILPHDKYVNFLCLSMAVRILYNPTFVRLYKTYAHNLLVCFIENAAILYSDDMMTYNLHCLHHVADLAECYGSLEVITAYAFENNMSKIKRLIRGPSKPVVQIARRLSEMNMCNHPTPQTALKLPRKQECYQLRNGKFCVIHTVQAQCKRALCEVFTRSYDFFTSPCESRELGIHQVRSQLTDMKYVDFEDLVKKALCIPLSLSFTYMINVCCHFTSLQFCVCELDNGRIVIVPRPWIFFDHDEKRWMCHWTSSLEKTKSYAIVNPKWSAYMIKKVWAKKGKMC